MKPNRVIGTGVALLGAALALAITAGFFAHRSNRVASPAPTVSPAAPSSDPGGEPRRGGTLHLVEPTDFRSLDPAIAYDTESVPIVRLLFRGLLDYDDGVNLVPAQAKDWSISTDGKTYTFHLRPGIRFADGREVEAEDYVFSFERILNPATESPGQGFFMGIQGAAEFAAGKAMHVSGLRAPDSRTLIIQLQQPQFTFRYVLAMTFAVAEPRDVVRRYGRDFENHLDGSGPYRLVEWQRGVRVRFARNPFYIGPDGYVDAVDVMIGGDSSTEAMMLERGELDRVLAGPPEAIHFERDPRLRSWLVGVPTANTDYMFMNTEMKPFDQVLVRRAVNYAINKSRLVRLTGGFATIATGIVPPAMSWTNSGLPVYDYDPKKARALLREAGYPNGFKTTFSYLEDSPIFVRMAQDVQQDLQQVGIDASLRPANFAAFDLEVTSRHQIPLGAWGWFQDYPDPSDFLDVLFNGRYITDTDCNNESFYNSPAANRLLDQATASVDPAERTRLFLQAEDLIMGDAPWVPLIHEILPVLYNPRVHGTSPHPVWLWRYEWMWLDPS
jgi:oligopeptide transport system substrate-binding protein